MDRRTESFISWYREQRPIYDRLANKICDILKNEIPQSIQCSSSCRAKSEDSALKKCNKVIKNKESKLVLKYTDFKTEITDYAGVRFVTYLTSDVECIGRIIEKTFIVDKQNSVDKESKLEVNEIGYIAKHYVVQLKSCDYAHEIDLKDLKCEIQIKTVLQDAWAQIFHDRQYKPIGEYPKDLIRKTNLVAGSLELLDNNIKELVLRYDKNRSLSVEQIDLWELLQEPINQRSLERYAYIKLNNFNLVFVNPDVIVELIKEMGYVSIGEIDKHFNTELLLDMNHRFSNYLFNVDRFYLYFCVVDKPDVFFEKSNCKQISEKSFEYLNNYVYNLNEYLKKYKVEIINKVNM